MLSFRIKHSSIIEGDKIIDDDNFSQISSFDFKRDRRVRSSSSRQSSFIKFKSIIDNSQRLRREASSNLQQQSLQNCLLEAEIQEKQAKAAETRARTKRMKLKNIQLQQQLQQQDVDQGD